MNCEISFDSGLKIPLRLKIPLSFNNIVCLDQSLNSVPHSGRTLGTYAWFSEHQEKYYTQSAAFTH